MSAGGDYNGLWHFVGTFDTDALTLLSAMTVPPDENRARLINQTVVNLKAANLWTKMGLLYIMAAHDEQAGRLNWVAPAANTMTAVNAPTFTVDRGFAGDGATSYLDTNTANNAIATYARDSAHIGSWGVTAAANSIFGTATALLASVLTGATRTVRVNNGGSLGTTGDVTTGHVVGVRRDSANLFSYRNGGTEVTGASTSAAVSTVNLNVGRVNSVFSTIQVAAAHAGNQLSVSDVLSLYQILRTYMTGVGVP